MRTSHIMHILSISVEYNGFYFSFEVAPPNRRRNCLYFTVVLGSSEGKRSRGGRNFNVIVNALLILEPVFSISGKVVRNWVVVTHLGWSHRCVVLPIITTTFCKLQYLRSIILYY